jgi:putative CocE/NonD family hydrolase
MRKRLLWRSWSLITILASAWILTFPQISKDEKTISIQWGIEIPLRDGARLNGTLYGPQKITEPLPVILTFTPYIADSYHDRGMYFAKNGYFFLGVDVRGRGNSGGVFEPFVHEGRDGFDVVEWLAEQPWCNGKVAMWGGSYAGFAQWSILKEFPPHLKTIVPAAAAHPGIDFPFTDNIFSPYDIQWLAYTSGVTPNVRLFGDVSYWADIFSFLYLKHLPFSTLDKICGNRSLIFQKWISHPIPDAYYDAMVPRKEDYNRFNIPILTITGHYDGAQPGALEYYRRHMAYGLPEAVANHFLVIGPWDHAGTRTPSSDLGGLHFGESSLVDMNKLHKEWYDWTMKAGKKPELLKKKLAYYLVGPGAECWKYADNLESLGTENRVFYLHSNGTANDAFFSGALKSENPVMQRPDHYTYDPLDIRPHELELAAGENSITDQRFALNLFGNGLVYHSEPFEHAVEISGCPKLICWMAMDVPDTDFEATIYEITPDGTSIALTQDRIRARYRDSLREEKLVKSGEINCYIFKSFNWFSRFVARGSRLRLVLHSPNSISLQKNYNSGNEVAKESDQNARTAHILVYHDRSHPSCLEIPILK